MSKTLFILNDVPYGTERSYNGLRLAGSLAKCDAAEVRVFLIGDVVGCAKRDQKVPQGFYKIENMLGSVQLKRGRDARHGYPCEMPDRVSRLRQRLLRLAEAQRAKPGCRCVRGERHVSKYLAATDTGRVRQVHVPHSDEQHVRESVERYRRFMSARADLAEQAERLLAFVDELGRVLLEPYPRDKPLPPASKVGRRPKPRGIRRGQP